MKDSILFRSLALVSISVFIFVSGDFTLINAQASQPRIDSISPESALIGTILTIEGFNLSTVSDSQVRLQKGGVASNISSRLSGVKAGGTVATYELASGSGLTPGTYKLSIENSFGISNEVTLEIKRGQIYLWRCGLLVAEREDAIKTAVNNWKTTIDGLLSTKKSSLLSTRVWNENNPDFGAKDLGSVMETDEQRKTRISAIIEPIFKTYNDAEDVAIKTAVDAIAEARKQFADKKIDVCGDIPT